MLSKGGGWQGGPSPNVTVRTLCCGAVGWDVLVGRGCIGAKISVPGANYGCNSDKLWTRLMLLTQ